MAASSRISSKAVRATLANKDILDMFQGALGAGGEAPLEIAHPKYLRMRSHSERFVRVLALLHGWAPLDLFPGPREHLGAYVSALRGQLASSFSAPDLEPFFAAAPRPDLAAALEGGRGHLYSAVPPPVAAQFGEVFAASKKCSLVNTVLVACKNLTVHKAAIGDAASLSDRFLTKGAGMSFAPLPDLPQLNLKQVYNDARLSPADREFLLLVLHKLLSVGHDLYEAVSSPDIDVGEFVHLIMSSIDDVKKQIPRCDQAFDKIAESVGLLRENFGDYYKDYTASGNATIIMENFVLDVSKSTSASPAITAQFRRIISHYRKLASQHATNPKLQSLFAQVDANFKELEAASSGADAPPGDDADDCKEEAPPSPPPSRLQGRAGKNRRRRARDRTAAAGEPEPEPGLADELGPADGSGPAADGPGPAGDPADGPPGEAGELLPPDADARG